MISRALSSSALLLSLVGAFSSTQVFAATSSFKGHPLAIMTCEALLSSSLDPFSTGENPLPVIRDAKYAIARATKQSGDVGTSYDDIFYSGSKTEIGSKKSTHILSRLEAIESELTSQDLQKQIVVLEFRGDNILAAQEQLERSFQEISAEYKKIDSRQTNLGHHLGAALSRSILLTTAATVYFSARDVVGGDFEMRDLFNFGVGIYAYQTIFKPDHLHNKDRFDSDFHKLTSFLKTELKAGDQNSIFVSGQKTTLPADFASMLMSDSTSTIEKSEVREEAFKECGHHFFVKAVRALFAPGEFMKKRVTFAGASSRTAYVDNIVFHDETTDEPVWLMVFRNHRGEPIGRKPKKKQQDEKKKSYQQDWGLAPQGQLVPVVVPTKR